MSITITLAPSEAHLLLTVLDDVRKGMAFPLAVYGAEGKAQLVDLAERVQTAVRAAGEASHDWIRPYHLTVLRELAAPDADIGRANWTGSDVAAELEARGLLTFEDELYYIADEGRTLVEDVNAIDHPGRDMAATCPWLTCPIGGHIVLEGRALVSEGQDLPERVGRLGATWEREGELCRFRLEGDGNLESAWAIVLSAGWAPGPRRVDRVTYTAPPTIEDGDRVDVAELVLDGEGRPDRFVVPDREDLQEVVEAIERVFGKALELGEWMRRDDGELVAEVMRWTP